MYECRIKEHWSHFLPLIQRIINYTIELELNLPTSYLDLPEGTTAQNPEGYLVKLRVLRNQY